MHTQSHDGGRGGHLGPTDLARLGNPLDFIAEDHLRHRQVCATLDALAAAEVQDLGALDAIRSFLLEEFAPHMADEEEDLFPLMRRRCEPEDEIDETLDRLQGDHRGAVAAAPEVMAAVARALSNRGRMDPDDRATLTAFAASERRHMIVENAIVLPLARARLTPGDLATLRLSMLRRRGLDRVLEEDADA